MPVERAPERNRRGEGRAGGLVALCLLLAIAAVAWLGPGEETLTVAVPESAVTPSVAPSVEEPRLPVHPELALLRVRTGEAPHTPLCTEARTATMTASFAERVDDGVIVDIDRWEATGWGGRAGYASFWSKCFHDGATVHIRSERDGTLLAIYDPASGLDLP